MDPAKVSVPARLESTAERIVKAAADDRHVLAAWLEGSLATGTGDDWSDLDVHLLVEDLEKFDPEKWVRTFTEPVLADSIPGIRGAFIFVTPDWVHIDVVLHTLADEWSEGQRRNTLWDPQLLIPDAPETTLAPPQANPDFPGRQVHTFLYFMGTVVAAIRRKNWLAASLTALEMRDHLLLALLLAENGVTEQPGRKHLDQFLSTEQLAVLDALPPIGLGEAGLLASLTEIATLYIARGRRLAERSGVEWPIAFSDATVRLWRDQLGIDLVG